MVTKTFRVVYLQKGPAYSTAQTEEKQRFGELLADLTKLVQRAAAAKRGATRRRSTGHHLGLRQRPAVLPPRRRRADPLHSAGPGRARKAAGSKRQTDCYSADTQLLTRRGWLPFPELEAADEVATVSPAGELTYRRPSAIQRYQYKGPMCHFAARSLDLLVTPNHRMWLRRKHATQYAFYVAHEVLQTFSDSSYYALKNQLSWIGCYQLWFNVPSIAYKRAYCAKPLPAFDMGDWCEFMGWYLSEGCTVKYRDRFEVQIAQQKPNKFAKDYRIAYKYGIHVSLQPTHVRHL